MMADCERRMLKNEPSQNRVLDRNGSRVVITDGKRPRESSLRRDR